MMRHLDEGSLQELLDGELDGSADEQAQRHLRGCPECASRFESARASVSLLGTALALLDPIETGAASRPPMMPATSDLRTHAWRGPAPLRAAALILVFAAAASATIPGAPVREWLASRFEESPARGARMERAEQSTLEAPPPPPPAAALGAGDEAGVSVEPSDGRIRILLVDPSPELQIRAVISDLQRGGVFARGGADNARFRTAAGTIEVIGAGPGEMRVEIPATAISATIEVDGRVYLVKEGGRLRLAGPAEEAAETEVVFRVRP